MSGDRSGGFIGNGDLIMVLLSKDPDKAWKQATVRASLKLSENQFNAAVAELGKWVKLNPENKSLLLADRAGGFIGNGYWGDDKIHFDAAQKAFDDRTGGVIGNG